MSALSRILVGLAIMVLGSSMVWKTPFYLQILGRNWWAEKNFGPGGTRFFYKLVGIAITVLGIMVVTDLFDSIVGGFITGLFGG